jgi:iron complex transport system ATP-binding protein
MLSIQDLSCGYGKKQIVSSISLEIHQGEILCLLGPNGVGKTTFFKTLLGFLKPQNGRIKIDDQDISKWSRKRLAQTIAYVPQAHSHPFPFRVIDVVVAGRNAHTGITSTPRKEDFIYAKNCMKELGIDHLANEIYTELSGGQQQMILITRAVCQNPQILIMDEPTSSLDYGNQVKIMNLIHKLTHKNIAVIMTTHSPDHALLCGARVMIFQHGKLVHIGEAKQIITGDLLNSIYDVDVNVCNALTTKNTPVQVCVPTLHYNI